MRFRLISDQFTFEDGAVSFLHRAGDPHTLLKESHSVSVRRNETENFDGVAPVAT
jgi:hypothetical protein